MSTGDPNGADEEGKGRMRVSRACTRCRSRKDKCDGLRPSCSTCQNASVSEPCTYEPSTKKRGLPEGYVRGLEKLYSVLMFKFDGFEDVVVQLLGDEKDALTRVWNHKTYGDQLHQSWKESRILQQLEVLLSAVEHPHPTGTKRKRDPDDDDGPSTTTSPLRASNASPPGTVTASPMDGSVSMTSPQRTTASSHSSLSDVLVKVTHSITALDNASPPKLNRQVPGAPPNNSPDQTFKLPKNASELINAYFYSVHCWLPILDRGEMHKKCFEFSRQDVPVDTSNSGLAKLSAALALSSLQSCLISQTDRALDVSYLYETSKRCIPLKDGLYVLGHVQALVLLVLADISSNRWSQAWLGIGLASRVMQDLSAPAKPMAKEETATYQACFILDTLTAFRLQRLPQIRRSQLPAYLVEDGQDEWGPITTVGQAPSPEPGFLLSIFNRVTDLFAILNDRICSLAGNNTANDLERLALSHSHLLGDNSPVSSHKVALKAVHSALSSYFAETGLFGSKVLHTVNVASTSLKQFPNQTPSIIASATLETIRHRVRAGSIGGSLGASPANSLSFDNSMVNSSLGSWPSGPFVADAPAYANPQQSATAPLTSYPDENHLNQAGNTNAAAVGISYGHASLLHQSPSGPYNSAIPNSPSFHGSEIDALFHEVAHLDTTEWAEGRIQGLKEFGFADSMAFEAFCNDPTRVFSSFQQSQMPNQSNPGMHSALQDPHANPRFIPPNTTEVSWMG